MRWAVLALALAACDVITSVGDHDVGLDASDAPTCHAPDAGVCGACQADRCCGERAACAAEPGCDCVTECVLGGSTVPACATHCGHGEHGAHEALLGCIAAACSVECR